MKTKLLKFARKNLYQYDGIWLVKTGTIRPLFAMLICESLNNRKFYGKQLSDTRKNFKNLIN
jgi:hypothetical protein